MKFRHSIFLAAALALSLSACAGPAPVESAPTPTPSASSSPTAKPVPDVVGKTYLAARTALNNDDYFSRVVGKDGKEWTTNIVPDDSVLAVSMKPAAGETPDTDTIYITVNMTEAEFKAASAAKAETAKVAAEHAKLATRYTYNCGSYSATKPKYKSYKEVWASSDYKNGGTCYIEIDGRDSYGSVPLLPSEQKLVDLVASKGGDVSVPSATVGHIMVLCAKLDPDYADQIVARPEWRKSEAAAALTVCPDAPHAAILQAEITAVKVSDGAKIVGQTMEPGTWKTKPGAKDCYWSRTTGGGDIIDNNFVGFAPDGVTVTVYAGEGFESSRCGTWTKIG
ncbi:PASTA domain-containing protein [Paenarthrobacter sp. AMU7]|uniref:PASTA domain-containing protein n=1 Tax=Paenarthrobacter sp. AMU7 TaxID=3162492 RepID=A0AB39YJR3_9MICC